MRNDITEVSVAKKRIHSIPYHEVRVRTVGSQLELRFQKRLKGGRVTVAKCVGSKQDKPALVDAIQAVIDGLEA